MTEKTDSKKIVNDIEDHRLMFRTAIVGIIAIGSMGIFSIYSAGRIIKAKEEEILKIKSDLEIKSGDYNGNNILDKFYEIDAHKVPLEIDNKSIDKYLSNNFLYSISFVNL